MRNRSILLTGPFSDAELRAVVDFLKAVEAGHPDRVYRATIIDPESEAPPSELLELFEKINPKRSGYERTLTFKRFKKP